ncbi:MAG: HAMP domain-containing histidine kinase [Betaproteobacteria bacterium]|nr:HAMP domain-containing histidine kinase [Betaproteobacteria bacterium]
MTRLYFRIYLAVLASLVVFALAAGLLWRTLGDAAGVWQGGEMVAQFAQNILPPASTDKTGQQAALEKISAGLRADVSLFAADRSLLAAVGAPLSLPEEEIARGMFAPHMRGHPAGTVRLPDGRWLVARREATDRPFRHGPGLALVVALVLLFIVVAIAAHPVVRRLTRRLERLQDGVETLGRGDLSARVKVEGHDEVARLAMSFNRAAARIEELLSAHRMLLANASHELRTPLTRIRLGVELLKEDANPRRKAELERDIAEIDELIEGILLSSRLDALSEPELKEEVDLLALAAEEGARYEGCSVGGEPVIVSGNPALLRRLLRNLVENALRHGKPPVSVSVSREGGRAALRVSDQGPGIAATEIETVFEPFRRARHADATGTGLGLSLVRKIARHHGGDARIEQNRPGGLTVLVML